MNGVSCMYMVVFIVIFFFPFKMPVDAESMNYTVVITGGLTCFMAMIWFGKQKDYRGPQDVVLDEAVLAKDAI